MFFFIYFLSLISHKQYGGKTHPFFGWVLFFYIFFKKSVDFFKNMIYIIYKTEKERRRKLKSTNRKTPRCFLMTQEEDMMLQKDAYEHEMNISAYLRWLIKKEHEKKERE